MKSLAGPQALAAGLFAALLTLAGCGAVKAPGVNVGTRLEAAVPEAILDLPLDDTAGVVRHLSSFSGRILVISDGMTLCQETCPLDTTTVVQTARRLDAAGLGSKVEFLTITVDPVRDTVPQIAAYRRLYTRAGQVPDWTVLTGSAADVARLWRYFGVYTKKVPAEDPPPVNWRTGKPLTYDIEHSDEVFFIDAAGSERFVLEGPPVVRDRSDIPKTIYHFLDEDGRHDLAHPPSTDWTEAQALQVLSWLLDRHVSPA
ncbi:hypothetical protein GCM10011575_42500 [Microlunatus endophyticus]|uniref:Protein SCO1/2 n=1 Tax=Microlunatus endophyticus TaxID=1716077 RepID=A0A917W7H3_9ACTN|nr:SCO family protein [Microlunatus endophyticus]GGL79700.1 hypothetical protein GCM10011575_42500 [Microlunatus endophyticus]